jgi:hypothetical protein
VILLAVAGSYNSNNILQNSLIRVGPVGIRRT